MSVAQPQLPQHLVLHLSFTSPLRIKHGDRAHLEARQGTALLFVRGWGNLWQDEGVGAGLVLEGHAHHQLGTQLPVHLLWLRQVLRMTAEGDILPRQSSGIYVK